MVDIYLAIVALSYLVLWCLVRFSLRQALAIVFLFSSIFHGLCLWSLFSVPAKFSYVVDASPAQIAGWIGAGELAAVGGVPVESMGNALSLLQVSGAVKMTDRSNREVIRPYGGRKEWQFWRPLDSYALEGASGGLSFFPRKPIFRGRFNHELQIQKAYCGTSQSVRIVSVGGAQVETISEVLSLLGGMPQAEFIRLRMMCSAPDNSLYSVFYHSKMPTEGQSLQSFFGFSGLPLVMRLLGTGDFVSQLEQVNGKPIFALMELEEFFSKYSTKEPTNFTFVGNTIYSSAQDIKFTEVELPPRLALLPWLHPNVAYSLLAGFPGALVRQLVSLPQVLRIPSLWKYLPKQAYAIDDGFSWTFLWFRLSELGASLFLALVLVGCLPKRFFQRRLLSGQSGILRVWVIVLVFQAASLFVVHRFVIP